MKPWMIIEVGTDTQRFEWPAFMGAVPGLAYQPALEPVGETFRPTGWWSLVHVQSGKTYEYDIELTEVIELESLVVHLDWTVEDPTAGPQAAEMQQILKAHRASRRRRTPLGD